MFAKLGMSLMRLSHWTSAHNLPSQIAAAVALGVCCGLVPPSSALLWVMLGILCVLPIHLPLALVTAWIVGCVSPILGSWLGEIGDWSLGHAQVLERISVLNRLPFAPWMKIHNTVVHGAMLVGALQLLPTFLIVWRLSRANLKSKRLLTEMHDEHAEVSYLHHELEKPSLIQNPSEMEFSTQRVLHADPDRPSPESKLESFLNEFYDQQCDSLSTSEIAARAYELATLTDEMLAADLEQHDLRDRVEGSEILDGSGNPQHAPLPSDVDSDLTTKSSHRGEVDSTHEHQVDQFGHAGRESLSPPTLDSEIISAPQRFPPADTAEKFDKPSMIDGEPTQVLKTHDSHGLAEGADPAVTAREVVRPRPLISPHDEELRYLLQHLKTIQEKA